MDCRFNKTLLSFYLDKECSLEETLKIEAHLKICSECQKEMHSLEKLSRTLNRLETVKVSEAYDIKFKDRLTRETAKKKIGFGIKNRIKERLEILTEVLFPSPVSVLARAAIIAIILGIILTQVFYLRSGVDILFAKGQVEIYRASDKKWKDLKHPAKFEKGDCIKVGEEGYVDIEYSRIYQARIKEETELVLEDPKNYQLKNGSILAKVEKRLGRAGFTIKTPNARAVVRGTEFLIDVVAETDSTWLGVLEGKVELVSKKDVVLVGPLQKASVEKETVSKTPDILSKQDIARLQEIKELGRLIVSLVISDTPDRVKELLKPAKFYVYGREPKEVQKLVSQSIFLMKQAARKNRRDLFMESISKLEEVLNKYPDKRYNPQFLLFIGTYYEYLDMHKEAIHTFQKVLEEYKDSKYASLALCAIGIVYEEGLKDFIQAKQAYQKVIEYFPNSLELQEAKSGLSRLK